MKAIFGFCDIRNFTEATEVFQESVISLVNQVASIVHSNTIRHGGQPNKNIGDAFLLVWKLSKSNDAYHNLRPMLKQKKAGLDPHEMIRQIEDSIYNENRILVDLALLTSMKILSQISSSLEL